MVADVDAREPRGRVRPPAASHRRIWLDRGPSTVAPHRRAWVGRGCSSGQETTHWGRRIACPNDLLPAPMGRRPSCPVLDAGPCPRGCWLAARRVGDGLHRLVRAGHYRAPLRRTVVRVVLQAKWSFQRDVGTLQTWFFVPSATVRRWVGGPWVPRMVGARSYRLEECHGPPIPSSLPSLSARTSWSRGRTVWG